MSNWTKDNRICVTHDHALSIGAFGPQNASGEEQKDSTVHAIPYQLGGYEVKLLVEAACRNLLVSF